MYRLFISATVVKDMHENTKAVRFYSANIFSVCFTASFKDL